MTFWKLISALATMKPGMESKCSCICAARTSGVGQSTEKSRSENLAKFSLRESPRRVRVHGAEPTLSPVQDKRFAKEFKRGLLSPLQFGLCRHELAAFPRQIFSGRIWHSSVSCFSTSA